MNAKDVLFGTAVSDQRVADFGLMALRVFAGLALALAHGMGKLPPSEGFVGMVGGMGLPMPETFAWLSGIAETVGGVLLAVGLLTRPAALFIVINMTTAVVLAHAGDTFLERERPLLFLAIAFAFLLYGAGRFSLDALIRRPRTPGW
jgi:putative oxidoreductase